MTWFLCQQHRSSARLTCPQQLLVVICECCIICHPTGEFILPFKRRKVFQGTNQSNHLGPVTSNQDQMWKLPLKDKKKMLAHKLIDVGGPDKTGCGPGRGKTDRKPTDLELMSFHGNSFTIWTEICHSLCLKSVYALISLHQVHSCCRHACNPVADADTATAQWQRNTPRLEPGPGLRRGWLPGTRMHEPR